MAASQNPDQEQLASAEVVFRGIKAGGLMLAALGMIQEARKEYAALSAGSVSWTNTYRWVADLEEAFQAGHTALFLPIDGPQRIVAMFKDYAGKAEAPAPAPAKPSLSAAREDDSPAIAWLRAHLRKGDGFQLNDGMLQLFTPDGNLPAADRMALHRYKDEIVAFMSQTAEADPSIVTSHPVLSEKPHPALLGTPKSSKPIPTTVADVMATATVKGHALGAFEEDEGSPGIWAATCEQCGEDVFVDAEGGIGHPLHEQCGQDHCTAIPPFDHEMRHYFTVHMRALGHRIDDNAWDVAERGDGRFFATTACQDCGAEMRFYMEEGAAGGLALEGRCPGSTPTPAPDTGPQVNVAPPEPPPPAIRASAQALVSAEALAAQRGHSLVAWRAVNHGIAQTSCAFCNAAFWVNKDGVTFGAAYSLPCLGKK